MASGLRQVYKNYPQPHPGISEKWSLIFLDSASDKCKQTILFPSLETQGQLVGVGKSLNGRGKNSGEEKSRNIFVLDFSLPKFFPRPFRLFPAPTNCPWVSEDVLFPKNCFKI